MHVCTSANYMCARVTYFREMFKAHEISLSRKHNSQGVDNEDRMQISFLPCNCFFFISVFSLVKTYNKIYFEEEASEKCLIINYYIFIHTTEIYIS